MMSISHITGGQKQAQRISRMIAMCTSKAKNLLVEYNSHCASCGDSAEATTITIGDVFDLSSAFWTSDHTYALQPID